jgi:hypothetical protein
VPECMISLETFLSVERHYAANVPSSALFLVNCANMALPRRILPLATFTCGMPNVQNTHVLSRIFSAAIKYGHMPGIACTTKGWLRREPVMWVPSETMLVGSTFTRC